MTQGQRGFGIVEIAIIVIGVGILAAAGYVAYSNFVVPKKTADTYQTAGTASMDHKVRAPEVSNSADLDKAIQSVDDNSYENDGASELDNELNYF